MIRVCVPFRRDEFKSLQTGIIQRIEAYEDGNGPCPLRWIKDSCRAGYPLESHDASPGEPPDAGDDR